MRILSFTKKWDKLKQPEFTTFRVPRKDADKGRDWHINEVVQVYFHNRQPDREFLGIAKIIDKSSTWLSCLDDEEAVADGFTDIVDMIEWMMKAHKGQTDPQQVRLNKLTLSWCKQATRF